MIGNSAVGLDQLPATLVLWDVDHTLIENGGVSKEAYALAFELLVGRAPRVRPVTDGRTDFRIMGELLAANSVDQVYPVVELERVLVAAMERMEPELPRRGYVLPGVAEVLKVLSDAPQVIQSALTGNIVSNARAKLSAFGLERVLDLDVGGYGSDDIVRSALVGVARGKVARKYGRRFDRASTVLVGDTPLDVEAARDGGAKIVAVATGSYPAAELAAAGADVVVEDLVDLDGFLRKLVELRGAGLG